MRLSKLTYTSIWVIFLKFIIWSTFVHLKTGFLYQMITFNHNFALDTFITFIYWWTMAFSTVLYTLSGAWSILILITFIIVQEFCLSTSSINRASSTMRKLLTFLADWLLNSVLIRNINWCTLLTLSTHSIFSIVTFRRAYLNISGYIILLNYIKCSRWTFGEQERS